ncbi:hypothetical protein TgHK011_000916 [Trichoderma gracile]|nr:hypothetical protein TgHK011_000916 [Trichoderma gracile]
MPLSPVRSTQSAARQTSVPGRCGGLIRAADKPHQELCWSLAGNGSRAAGWHRYLRFALKRPRLVITGAEEAARGEVAQSQSAWYRDPELKGRSSVESRPLDHNWELPR